MIPKSVMPTAIAYWHSRRSTILSLRKKLTSSTANLEWCQILARTDGSISIDERQRDTRVNFERPAPISHVHFSRDSYSTFIRRVIWPGKSEPHGTPRSGVGSHKLPFKNLSAGAPQFLRNWPPVRATGKNSTELFLNQNSTLNPHEIVTVLPRTISFGFVSPLPGTRGN